MLMTFLCLSLTILKYRSMHVPALRDTPCMEREFDLAVLEDSSASFFYALLEDTYDYIDRTLTEARVVVPDIV